MSIRCRVKHRTLFITYHIIIPPPRQANKQTQTDKETQCKKKFKVRLLNDKSIIWLYKKEWMIV
jgi:hypothetical protein